MDNPEDDPLPGGHSMAAIRGAGSAAFAQPTASDPDDVGFFDDDGPREPTAPEPDEPPAHMDFHDFVGPGAADARAQSPAASAGPTRLAPAPRPPTPAHASASRRHAHHNTDAPVEAVPPTDLSAERAILAAALSDPAALALAQSAMRANDLYDHRHRVVFEALRNLATRGEIIDPLNVEAEARRLGHGDIVTLQYLLDLAFVPGSTLAVEGYARRVAKLSVVRNLLDVTHKLQSEGYGKGLDPDAFLDTADRLFREAMDKAVRGGPERVYGIVTEVFNTILEAAQQGGTILGTRSGFRDIDHMHLGLHATDLIVLAARPAMGKSAFALNLAYNVSRQPRRKAPDQRCRVVVFSLEMGKQQLVQRLLSARSGVELTNLRKGELNPQDESSLREAAAELGELELYIDDTAGLTPHDIRARCKLVAMNGDIDLVVVDYLQLMRGTGGDRQSTENAIAECSQALKGLAKELRCTTLALSQLNREVENRSGRKPQMSDLRGSGSIEQDADIIWFIHREHYYDPTKDEHLAELIVAKHRAGAVGAIKLYFDGRLTKFGTYDDRINDGYVG